MAETVIKILGGSHRGGEAALGEKCLVGSGPDCDIILSDEGIAERHLLLEVADDKVLLTVLAEPVYLDGEPITAQASVVLPLQVISLGFAALAFGSADSDWQSLKLPLIKQVDASTDPADAQVPESAPQNELEGASGETPSLPSSPGSAGSSGGSPATKAIEAKGGKHGLLWGGIAASAFLFLGIGYYALPGLFVGPKSPAKAPMPPLAEITKMVADYGGLKADSLGSVVRVSGFLPRSEDLTHLKEQVRREGLLEKTRFHVVVGDEAARTLRNSLTADGMAVEVELDGSTLKLFGVVTDKKSLRRLLRDGRYHSLGVKDETVTSDELITYIRSILRQKRFNGHLDINVRKDDGLSVAGLVGEKDYNLWQEVETALAKSYPLLRVDDEVKPIPGRGFAVRSVVVGPKSFVTLGNGQIIAEGQPLREGFILNKIAEGHLLVGIGSREYRYVYN